MVSVLCVCLGNICRSPIAHGVLERKADNIGLDCQIDSCGILSYHAGEQPDLRSIKVAQDHGYDIEEQRSRQIIPADFQKYDYILAMDNANIDDLLERCPVEFQYKIELFMAYAEDSLVSDIPDPYYGSERDFDYVLTLAEKAADGLLKHLRKKHLAE